jgi:putative pyruvate formate lyase activating enzyme
MVEPNFLKLYRTGELERRVAQLEKLLESCVVCPKDCGNNRLKDEIAACYSGRLPIVSSYTAHFGEEPVLSGTGGAGNIFFGNCNLRCVYCQNYQISQTWGKHKKKNETTHERLAEMMLELQAKGLSQHRLHFASILRRKWLARFYGRQKKVSPANCLQHKRLMIRSKFCVC